MRGFLYHLLQVVLIVEKSLFLSMCKYLYHIEYANAFTQINAFVLMTSLYFHGKS